ncbi:MAG: histidine phosphatase family protein, partial [Chloroflexota bacterium]
IVSSPYVRAVESIRPLAHRLGIKVETDERLRERLLSQGPLPDPLERLQESFDDLDMRLAGGESSREAMARGVSAIEDLRRHVANVTVVVTHGNLLTLLLKHFDDRFGFEEWRRLTNPDIFCVTIAEDGARVERIWGA